MDVPLLLAILAAAAIAIYAIADGFDLGIGILLLLAPHRRQRDIMIESVAPCWKGNETWLILSGAVIWATFPKYIHAQAVGFFIPIATMWLGVVARSISFKNMLKNDQASPLWNYAFAGGSIVAVISQGFVLGNFLQAINQRGELGSEVAYVSSGAWGLVCAIGLLGGYALLGATWLVWRTDGSTQTFGREIARPTLLVATAMIVAVSADIASTMQLYSIPNFGAIWTLWLAILAPLSVGLAVQIWLSLWSHDTAKPLRLSIGLFSIGFVGLSMVVLSNIGALREKLQSSAASEFLLWGVLIAVVLVLPFPLSYTGRAFRQLRRQPALRMATFQNQANQAPRHRAAALRTDLHIC